MKNRHADRQQYTPVRFSHLMSHAGVGSIVRSATGRLMVIADTRFWLDKDGQCSAVPVPYVRRISKALVDGRELRMPPQAEMDEGGASGSIRGSYLAAVLFPKWALCRSCGFLYPNPWPCNLDQAGAEPLRCTHCQPAPELEQVTWCAVSSRGHLAEVGWHYLAHPDGKGTHCKPDYQSAYLRLGMDGRGKRQVICSRCGSRGSYENQILPSISGQQPWFWDSGPRPQLDETDRVQVLALNSPGVYIPERVNALVIPPESRQNRNLLVDRLYGNSADCRVLAAAEQRNRLLRRSGFLGIAEKYETSLAALETAWEAIKAGYPHIDEANLQGDLKQEEYKAFLRPLESLSEDEDFVTGHQTENWRALLTPDFPEALKPVIRCIDQLVIARRLREIQIFKGFYRLSVTGDDGGRKTPVSPDIDGSGNWLPAIELFGEGVFFTLNQTWLECWENEPTVIHRADQVRERFGAADMHLSEDVEVTPRFLLLHTLAHLVIRELEVSAGYPAAALHERIYCSRARNMAGILIYTAVPDIAGSLGGIIESAEPRRFLALLEAAFKHAQWCSLDPVCAEHEGQGPGWLNRAACHACTLVPEPACDYGNVFLDRIFIKGSQSNDPGKAVPALLDFISTS
ncbi:MAG: DUF1998 domain-containing protein [Thiothrix sp.]|nr:DUF1998 domain-containing protein [Thiothrix sp.]HPE61590.1 DUF1998 domain-containing protein [Thiolinea sp.]